MKNIKLKSLLSREKSSSSLKTSIINNNLNESFNFNDFKPKVWGGQPGKSNSPFSFHLSAELPNPTGNNLIKTDEFDLKILTKFPGTATDNFDKQVKSRIDKLENDIKQKGVNYQKEVQKLIKDTVTDLKKIDDKKLKNDQYYQDTLKKLQ